MNSLNFLEFIGLLTMLALIAATLVVALSGIVDSVTDAVRKLLRRPKRQTYFDTSWRHRHER